MDDLELLAEYARSRSHETFARVAERYIDLIYSAALRQTRDPHVAEDVTQAVLIILMNKSGKLAEGTIVPAWLLTVTRYAALDAIKMEARRKRREQQVATMNTEARAEEQTPQWEQVSPLLDAALMKLSVEDRDAVVLRYLLGKSPEEIAWVMGVSDQAARKRVSRALGRLRKLFARQGVAAGEAALGSTLLTHAVAVSPPAMHALARAIALPASGALSTPPTVLARGVVKSLWWATHGKLALVITILLLGGVGGAVLLRGHGKQSPILPEAQQPTPSAPVAGTVNSRVYLNVPAHITRLMFASNRGDLPAVRQFLADGDDPNVVSSDGNNTTALMYALTHGGDSSYEIVRSLIDAGANVNVRTNPRGDTALIRACVYRSPRAAQLLLDHGADINAKNNQGADALSIAQQQGNAQVIELIQKAQSK